MCQGKKAKFILPFLHIYLTVCNILNVKLTFHIFDTNKQILQTPDNTISTYFN